MARRVHVSGQESLRRTGIGDEANANILAIGRQKNDPVNGKRFNKR